MSRYIPVAAKRQVLRLYRWRASRDGTTRTEAMYWVMERMTYMLAEGIAQTERIAKEDLDRYRAAHHYAVQMNRKPWARNWIDPGEVTAGHPRCSRGVKDEVIYPRRPQTTERAAS